MIIKQNSNGYQPDIDGLRALAILGVLGFHFAPNYLKGGFIGVDIFFCNLRILDYICHIV